MKIIFTALLVFKLICVNISYASIISEINTNTEYSSGKFANLQGLEWLSLDATSGKSRSEIDAGFNNLLLNGWQYATRSQTEILVTSLWGGNYSGWSQDNYSGASWFLNTFSALAYYNNGNYENQFYSKFLFGSEQECSTEVTYTCFGAISTFENYKLDITNATDSNGLSGVLSYTENSGQGGLFYYQQGLNAGSWDDTNIAVSNSFNANYLGSLLVRSSNVPEPSIIFLLITGLIGLKLTMKCRRGLCFD